MCNLFFDIVFITESDDFAKITRLYAAGIHLSHIGEAVLPEFASSANFPTLVEKNSLAGLCTMAQKHRTDGSCYTSKMYNQ